MMNAGSSFQFLFKVGENIFTGHLKSFLGYNYGHTMRKGFTTILLYMLPKIHLLIL